MYNLIIDKNKSYKNISLKKILNLKEIDGNFTIIKKKGSKFYIIRDYLGTKKLFWSKLKNKIIISNNFINLSRRIRDNNNIKSFRSGFLTIIKNNGEIIKLKKLRKNEKKFKKNITQNILSKLIKKKINQFLRGLRSNYGKEVYVCLSGGLDSTVIAYLASKVFKKVTAISCTILNNKQYINYLKSNKKINLGNLSKDFLVAKKISNMININFKPVIFNEKECLHDLKKVMYLSQDWRDFNVHCALLNYQIAKALKKDKNYKSQPVITGDFMNEFVADYKTEIINNKKYYEMPIKNKKNKQKFLIKGLRSSDRENGIFNHFNIPSFQPFSIVSSVFERLPDKFFKKNNVKYLINGRLIEKKLFKIINRKKIRAQVGGKNAGILGFMINRKINQKELNKIFIKNFKFKENFLKSFIFLGDYIS